MVTTLPPVFVGREHELSTVRALVEHAARGEAGAVLICGEAGIGKTAVVHRVLDATRGMLVLQGDCLPLTSIAIPLAPLRSALRHVPAALPWPPDLVEGVLAPVQLDDWLDAVCAITPVVLSIDDLHWADGHTLDVLMYLLAGRRDRRLAIVATLRHTELGPGQRISSWLADVRRMPGFVQIRLGPLTSAETMDQLTALLGGPPHESLQIEVFARTLGNAYLNRLLVTDLGVDARHLPATLPQDLQEALIAHWGRLSPAARLITAVIALGGLRLSAVEITKIIEPHSAVPPHSDLVNVQNGLTEAVAGHVLEIAPQGTYWFHHPLQAEVLGGTLAAEERQRWHEIFAEHLESTDIGDGDTTALILLADHHFAADHREDAFRSGLRAAAAAASSSAYAEAIRLVRRAITSLPDPDHTPTAHLDLLHRVRDLAERGGEMRAEREAIDEILDLVDPEREPLLVAFLMVRRVHLRQGLTEDFAPIAEIEQAVRLTAAAPASWEHAFALADQARLAVWSGDPRAGALADRALVVARVTSRPRALAYALTARAMVETSAGRSQRGSALAAAGQREAIMARDFWGYVHATMWRANARETWTSAEFGRLMHEARIEALSVGAPPAYVNMLAVAEAGSALSIGDWRACARLLRTTLGTGLTPLSDVASRLTAARLAALQGRGEEAQAHLDRALEISAVLPQFSPLEFSAITAEVQVQSDRPEAAARTALAALAGVAPHVTMCEWLVPLAARALADLAQRDREAGEVSTGHRELMLLEHAYPPPPHGTAATPSIITDGDVTTPLYRQQLQAMAHWYAAECGRARERPENGQTWLQAAEMLTEAHLPWEAAYSHCRAAEALLRSPRPDRHAAASSLRCAAEAGRLLEARPLQARVERLARAARISLAAPVTAGHHGLDLTRRETEILAHLVAGRTYREIAEALFLSEKTVSSHVSNMLRKTGSANRIELARRAGNEQDPPG